MTQATSRFKFGWMMCRMLPSAIWWRLRIIQLNETSCTVSLPYSWRAQNPFRSIYFAALVGAGELSTGALCQMYIAGLGRYSMLVVEQRAVFTRKADSRITFECQQGEEVKSLLSRLIPGETAKLEMVSTGVNVYEEEVAKVFITWSFKRKL